MIPVEHESFDLIYAIEVSEHTPRPYGFFIEGYAKLKLGGVLIFSVPNSLHVKSRLSFLSLALGNVWAAFGLGEECWADLRSYYAAQLRLFRLWLAQGWFQGCPVFPGSNQVQVGAHGHFVLATPAVGELVSMTASVRL